MNCKGNEMGALRRVLGVGLLGRAVFVFLTVVTVCPGPQASRVWAQAAPIEVTQIDLATLKVLNSSQWAALGVRLGDSKEAALRRLQGIGNIKAQDDPNAGRIFVVAPPTGNTVVMSLRIIQSQVTAINLVGGFSEWLKGDTQLMFRAFEDDSIRHKVLGREDQREAIRGGTNEAPTLDMTYAYFKEGVLLHYTVKRSADGKQVESQREMVLIYPAKPR